MKTKLIFKNEKKRLAKIESFLKPENIPLGSLIKIKGDASFRSYYRIKNSNLILMDANPRNNEKITSFIKIQKILLKYKIKAPKIYKKDTSLGLMIMEDLGKKKFSDYSNDSKVLLNLYIKSLEVLDRIHVYSILEPNKIKNLKKYTLNEQMKETELFFDWYLKKHLNKPILNDEKNRFKKIFKKIYKNLNIKNYCLVLRDFHVDNIIPANINQKGTNKKIPISFKDFNLGIIDFQDALVGSPAYDLSSLVEDVRAPISSRKKGKLINHFKANIKQLFKDKIFLTSNPESSLNSKLKDITNNTLNEFETKVSYFSIQRNLKILGIFCRLKHRDKKSNYMKYLPQAKKFIRENLKNPQFIELKNWFVENKINV